MKLSQDAFAKAQQFIEKNARPLDAARFRFHFGSETADDVLTELSEFQNSDGGFGHGLAADIRAPESSVLDTTHAYQTLREIGMESFEDVAAPTVTYLIRTLDTETLTWRIIPETAANSPHAPWWNQKTVEKTFGHFLLNPTAEALGYLIDYPFEVPPEQLTALVEEVVSRVSSRKQMEMFDFLCCKRLAETKGLDRGVREALLGHLHRLLEGAVSTSRADWGHYCLRPVQVADSPESPFHEALQDVIPANLDFEIEEQGPDGSWAPQWDWDGNYPEAWEVARREWCGILTLEKLLVLKRYDRIDGVS